MRSLLHAARHRARPCLPGAGPVVGGQTATGGRTNRRLGQAVYALATPGLLTLAACSFLFDADELSGRGPAGGAAGASSPAGRAGGAPASGAGGVGGASGGGAAGAANAAGAAGVAGATGGAGGGPSTRCGNGAIDPGEECDEGEGNGPATACSDTCVVRCESSFFTPAAAVAKDPATKHCYALVNVSKTFDDAVSGCELGADVRGFVLASVRSLAELDFVRDSLQPQDGLWVGLHDVEPDLEAVWSWVDGSPGFVGDDIAIWGENEPDDLAAGEPANEENGDEECVFLAENRGYFLADIPCERQQPYLCEYSPAPL